MDMMMKLFGDICNSANVKNFDLRSHFSNPLDIDIFNRGDIEIFGQYIIQEKLRGKLYKMIILNQGSIIKIPLIYTFRDFVLLKYCAGVSFTFPKLSCSKRSKHQL